MSKRQRSAPAPHNRPIANRLSFPPVVSLSSSAADSRNGTGRIHGFKTENSFQILVDLQCCTGRRLILLLFLKNLKNVTAVLFHSGDPWHWKNSQSALRQVVGSLVPEIAYGNQYFGSRLYYCIYCFFVLVFIK